MFAGLFGSNNAKENASSKSSPQRRLSTTAKPPVIVAKRPFPHPLPHTKVRIVSSADGLVLSGYRGKLGTPASRSVLVQYGKVATVSVLEEYDATADARAPKCVCHGVLGILRFFNESYLLVITSKKRVASYAETSTKRIYRLSGVMAIPLSNRSLARDGIQKLGKELRSTGKTSGSSTSSDETSSSSSTGSDSETSAGDVTVNLADSRDVVTSRLQENPDTLDRAIAEGTQAPVATHSDHVKPPQATSAVHSRPAKPPFAGLGRFFWSGKGHTDKGEADELVSWAESASTPTESKAGINLETAAVALTKEQAAEDVKAKAETKTQTEAESLKALDKKILREMIAELTSGGFFFSQDFDLTACMQVKWQNLQNELQSSQRASPSDSKSFKQSPAQRVRSPIDVHTEEPRASEPLTSRADRRFWYNRWLSKDLVEATEFTTVLMQGYVQRRRVSLRPASNQGADRVTGDSQESEPIKVEMLIISRRSIERPGLRYQRRGVNESGGVANFVETEFIMSTNVERRRHLTSYVQTRGSIPLFWSQSPWSLKPIPVLDRGEPDNDRALCKHFDRQTKAYFGSVSIVNLAETTGKEGLLVAAYREGVERLNRPEIVYNEWDFHHICKGMRYERISLLLEQLESQIDHMSSFWLMDHQNLATQRGVMRINCMDCLDRTNVVESALARKHVWTVLEHLGIHDLASGSRDVLDLALNELWANNGDAISREYAGTSALKGDFVRSGKRNWLGQFNDATNSIARYWQNTILDFFKQALIDYVLGINTNAFLEFSEKMQTSDPGEITRLATIRQAAIDTAAAAVLADGEDKLFGWTLISPATSGHIRDATFEEKILILTAKALYACSFEYTLQKVRDFVRIPLGQVVKIHQGEYILSALDPAARNPEENYGFCLHYLPEGVMERSRTYSIRNTAPVASSATGGSDALPEETLQIAFKAVRKDLIRDFEHTSSPTIATSRVQVLDIVDHIRQACEDIGATSPGDDGFVVESPIISLAEAKAQVSLLDRLNYEVKNMIWL